MKGDFVTLFIALLLKYQIISYIALALLGIYSIDCAFAEDNIITVDFNKDIGGVNKKVFGNNFIGYDPKTYEDRVEEYYGLTDYGAGVWNPVQNEPVKELVGLAKEAGLSIIRFPGGCGVHHYNWKKTIGKERRHFLFGLDEFLKTVEAIGAEPVITVSYFTGSEQDAADLVEYLNTHSNDKRPWADKRADNGHLEPYGARYFEFGNEVWHGDHRKIKTVNPKEYARRYLIYQTAMKQIDPRIQLGLVLGDQQWDKAVLEEAGDKVDFLIRHTYPPNDSNLFDSLLKKLNAKELFKVILGALVIDENRYYTNTLRFIKEKTGRDDVYFAVTEYNGGFVQNKPIPYRHSLGNALINAELLRIFMDPEHKVLMANYWQFANEYWGMIQSRGNFMTHDYRKPMGYIKRPNYYVYELYNKHFGDVLIDVNVKGDSYDLSRYKSVINTKGGLVTGEDLLSEKWKTEDFSGVYADEKNGVLEIDFRNPKKFNYFHSEKDAVIQSDTYYKLSGYIRTESLNDTEGISLEIIDARGWTKTHSSAITKKITGTADWQCIDVIYKTLPDAESVVVRARRVGDQGPLKGKAFFKDVKLQKYIPVIDMSIPYLSVNASKNKDGSKVYLMVINKNMNEPITSLVELMDFLPSERINAWILNGPSIEDTNEKKSDNVKITHKQFEIKNNTFEFTFEPHSLTAIEITRSYY